MCVPWYDFFLNVLGTGRLVGCLPKHLGHLGGRRGRVLILGSYKFRQQLVDALEDIERNGESDVLKALAKMTGEIGRQAVRDCVDALTPEVRGGHLVLARRPRRQLRGPHAGAPSLGECRSDAARPQ